jgi:diguanylate cyclase (GGDEF)-like protein
MSQSTASLLLVDDEEMNRDMLGRRLELHGYKITCADGGRAAIDLIERQTFDLVVLDLMMPEINGFQVLSRVRETYSGVELPVIIMTAKSETSDVVRGFRDGANDYVTKPVDFPVALARIATHVAHRRAVGALHESEARYALAARGTNDGLWDWDLRTETFHYSPRWKSMLGFDEGEVGTGPFEWLGRVHPEDYQRLKNALDDHRQGLTPHFECEYRMLGKDQSYRWMLSRGLALCDKAGRPMRMAGSQTDITGGKVVDALTGLPNRLLFLDRLGRAIERSRRNPPQRFAVMFLDLDRFKVVNDSLGHRFGDELLVEISRRLEHSLRITDTVARIIGNHTVARLGGDEFTILLEDLQSHDDASVVADRILSELAKPFVLCEQEIYASASIGITRSRAGYDSPEDMLRDADTAMYCAKTSGKARFAVFDDSMREKAVIRLRVENDLRRALERQEFRVHYQPIHSIASRQVIGFEALVRWQHPELGLRNPADFIPIAEETGLIVQLGKWVLCESCRQMNQWHRIYPSTPPFLCVNVSSKQFAQPDFVTQVRQVLDESGLDPRVLKLEITEETIMSHTEAVAVMLAELRMLGVQISIDDFGTGYSSLSYLQKLPVDTVKIDQSFVNRMGLHDNLKIVQAIVNLAHTLKLDVVAEGVETEDQCARLAALACEYAQGYLYSKPLDAESIARMLSANLPAAELGDSTATAAQAS